MKPQITLQANSPHLNEEKEGFLEEMCKFLSSIDFGDIQTNGRPKVDLREVIKQLLIMSYNSMSYRRSISDLNILKNQGYIEKILSKSTVNDYSNKEEIVKTLQRLIQISALYFKDEEDTLIVDSTWFGEKMYVGGAKNVHENKQGLINTRKIHIGCLKSSKIICYAKPTKGTAHDNPIFTEIVSNTAKIFNISYCLGDKGYLSRKNYLLCQNLEIEAYLDFKKNSRFKGGGSRIWKDQIKLWKNKPEVWKESYRYRVLIESLFSVIKKKFGSYLRSRNNTSKDVEMLLKCLVYNFTVIARFSFRTDFGQL